MKTLLLEGGAGGHMAHPFDLPYVNTGKDLFMFFTRAVESIKHTPPSLKVDGINATIKLTNKNGILEFALDRGSAKALDLTGVTKQDLVARFGEGHGLIAIGNSVLTIFNNALPMITPILQKLGMINDFNILLNLEYISNQSNIIQYDKNCIVLHGLKRSINTPGPRGLQRNIIDLPYVNLIDQLAEQLKQHVSPYGFTVYSHIPVKFMRTPDLNGVLNQLFTINIDLKQKETHTLKDWLNKIKMPKNGSFMLNGVKTQYIAKKLYIFVKEGNPLIHLSKDINTQNGIKNGVITLHLTRVLGDEILKCLTSPIGDVSGHEGVVIQDPSIASIPVKITGNFIITGMQSKFQQKSILGENNNIQVIACYPGRFQPFHKGHYIVYKQLEKEFGKVLILTSDIAIDEKHPFSFSEKQRIITDIYNIPINRMRSVKNPYLALEILQNIEPSSVILIMALGEKDAQRFTFKPKKDGSPSYYQPFSGIENCTTSDKHGYIKILTNVTYNTREIPEHLRRYFTDNIISATAIRDAFKNVPLEYLISLFEFVFGKFNQTIFDLCIKKFRKI